MSFEIIKPKLNHGLWSITKKAPSCKRLELIIEQRFHQITTLYNGQQLTSYLVHTFYDALPLLGSGLFQSIGIMRQLMLVDA